MTRQLFIMRHAKSSWETEAETDFERPLAKRGKIDAPRMGTWLLENQWVPDHVVSSPAERAKQTALKACKSLGIHKDDIFWDPRIYGAGTQDLLHVLAEVPPHASRVLLVGHNPGLEFLFSFLAEENSEISPDLNPIKTATVVLLDIPCDWKEIEPGCAKVMAIQYPRDLPPLPE